MEKKLKFLILEDNELTVEKLSKQLDMLFNCEIDKVLNGQDALEYSRNNKYDLLISDIYVPLLNGLDFIEEIRKEDKDLPIIITSACHDEKFKNRAKKLGIDFFMVKPIFIKEIADNIKDLLKIDNVKF